MPLGFNPTTKNWEIKDPTTEEIAALVKIGKRVIVESLAGAYTNDMYKTWLLKAPDSEFFEA